VRARSRSSSSRSMKRWRRPRSSATAIKATPTTATTIHSASITSARMPTWGDHAMAAIIATAPAAAIATSATARVRSRAAPISTVRRKPPTTSWLISPGARATSPTTPPCTAA
jgi:hypothetical protein